MLCGLWVCWILVWIHQKDSWLLFMPLHWLQCLRDSCDVTHSVPITAAAIPCKVQFSFRSFTNYFKETKKWRTFLVLYPSDGKTIHPFRISAYPLVNEFPGIIHQSLNLWSRKIFLQSAFVCIDGWCKCSKLYRVGQKMSVFL